MVGFASREEGRVVALALQCIDINPEHRPTTEEAVELLEGGDVEGDRGRRGG